MIKKENDNACGACLASAFAHDPWLNFLFNGTPSNLLAFFTFLVKHIDLEGGKRFVHIAEEGTVAVACVAQPTTFKTPFLNRMKAFLLSLNYFIKLTPRQRQRLNSYRNLTTSAQPNTPHHYLVCIGVTPNVKGKGIGKSLLERIHAIVEADPTSAGIGLDTENPENLPFYQHFGYTLIKTQKLGDLTIYSMFRPNKQPLFKT